MNNKSLIGITVLAASLVSQVAYADSTRHFSNAAEHSSNAVGQSVTGSAKVGLSAIAVPFIVIGEIGQASHAAGDDLWDAANTPTNNPLPISNDIISVGPAPNLAIKDHDNDEGEE